MTNEDEYVTQDDLFISRDEHGDLVPVEVEAGKFGKVKVIPMTYGKAERLFGGVTGEQDIDSDFIAEILNEHFVTPSLDLSGEDVRNMKPFAPQALLAAVMDVSGLDAEVSMDSDGDAAVSFEGN